MIRKATTQEDTSFGEIKLLASQEYSTNVEDKLLELDFQTKKDITLKDVSLYSITIPLKHVQRNNVTPETMLYNLTKTINWNDISYIDYTEGARNGNTLKPLSERFCDNIILYYLVPITNNANK